MESDMDLQVSVSHKETGLSFILHITDADYSAGCPGTGPTYSCGGTPPEPAEAYATEGWVELDGHIENIADMTSEDKAVLALMKEDNKALFDMLYDADEEDEQKVYEAIIDYKENEWYEEHGDGRF